MSKNEIDDVFATLGIPDEVKAAYLSLGVSSLYDWQRDCLYSTNVLRGQNLLYCAPTSGGKTLIAELVLLKTVLNLRRKAVFVLPYVSLVLEKERHLKKMVRAFNLARPPSQRVKVRAYCAEKSLSRHYREDILVCTIEKAQAVVNALLRRDGPGHVAARRLGCLLLDETHLLGSAFNGHLLELLVSKVMLHNHLVSGQGGAVQVVALSATLGRVEEVARWLGARLYTTSFRPVPLKEFVLAGPDILDKQGRPVRPSPVEGVAGAGGGGGVGEEVEGMIALCREGLAKGQQVLVFCPSKQACQDSCRFLQQRLGPCSHLAGGGGGGERVPAQTAAYREAMIAQFSSSSSSSYDPRLFDSLRCGIAYHHAGLDRAARDCVEEGYLQRHLSILCATSTLAAGVNLPAGRVVIRSLQLGREQLTSTHYLQMCGRAGRAGQAVEGEAFLVVRNVDRPRALHLLAQPLPDIASRLDPKIDGGNALLKGVVEVVGLGLCTSVHDLLAFLRATLWAQQMIASHGLDHANKTLQAVMRAFLTYLLDARLLVTKQQQQQQQQQQRQRYYPSLSTAQGQGQGEGHGLGQGEGHGLGQGEGHGLGQGEVVVSDVEATRFGRAILQSSFAPDEAVDLFEELLVAQEGLCLELPLHLLYLIAPSDHSLQVDFSALLRHYERSRRAAQRAAVAGGGGGGAAAGGGGVAAVFEAVRVEVALLHRWAVQPPSRQDLLNSAQVTRSASLRLFLLNLSQEEQLLPGQQQEEEEEGKGKGVTARSARRYSAREWQVLARCQRLWAALAMQACIDGLPAHLLSREFGGGGGGSGGTSEEVEASLRRQFLVRSHRVRAFCREMGWAVLARLLHHLHPLLDLLPSKEVRPLLAAVPRMSRKVAQVLVSYGVRSVEHLLATPRETLAQYLQLSVGFTVWQQQEQEEEEVQQQEERVSRDEVVRLHLLRLVDDYLLSAREGRQLAEGKEVEVVEGEQEEVEDSSESSSSSSGSEEEEQEEEEETYKTARVAASPPPPAPAPATPFIAPAPRLPLRGSSVKKVVVTPRLPHRSGGRGKQQQEEEEGVEAWVSDEDLLALLHDLEANGLLLPLTDHTSHSPHTTAATTTSAGATEEVFHFFPLRRPGDEEQQEEEGQGVGGAGGGATTMRPCVQIVVTTAAELTSTSSASACASTSSNSLAMGAEVQEQSLLPLLPQRQQKEEEEVEDEALLAMLDNWEATCSFDFFQQQQQQQEATDSLPAAVIAGGGGGGAVVVAGGGGGGNFKTAPQPQEHTTTSAINYPTAAPTPIAPTPRVVRGAQRRGSPYATPFAHPSASPSAPPRPALPYPSLLPAPLPLSAMSAWQLVTSRLPPPPPLGSSDFPHLHYLNTPGDVIALRGEIAHGCLSFELVCRPLPTTFLRNYYYQPAQSPRDGLRSWASLLSAHLSVATQPTCSSCDLSLPLINLYLPAHPNNRDCLQGPPHLLTGCMLYCGSAEVYYLPLPVPLPLPRFSTHDHNVSAYLNQRGSMRRVSLDALPRRCKEAVLDYLGCGRLLVKAPGLYPSSTSASNPLFVVSRNWCLLARHYLMTRWREGEAREWRLLQEIMSLRGLTKVSHDLKTKIIMLRERDVLVQGPLEDPSVAYSLLLPTCSSSSSALPVRTTPPSLTPPRRWCSEGVHEEVRRGLWLAAQRTVITLQAAARLHPLLESAGLLRLYRDVEAPLLLSVATLELHGLSCDVRGLARLRRHLLDRKVVLESYFKKHRVSTPEEVRKEKERLFGLAQAVYRATRPSTTTTSSSFSTTTSRDWSAGRSDAMARESSASQELLLLRRRLTATHPLFALLSEYNSLEQALPILSSANCNRRYLRVRPLYDPLGTETGRMIARQPCIQHLPKRLVYTSSTPPSLQRELLPSLPSSPHLLRDVATSFNAHLRYLRANGRAEWVKAFYHGATSEEVEEKRRRWQHLLGSAAGYQERQQEEDGVAVVVAKLVMILPRSAAQCYPAIASLTTLPDTPEEVLSRLPSSRESLAERWPTRQGLRSAQEVEYIVQVVIEVERGGGRSTSFEVVPADCVRRLAAQPQGPSSEDSRLAASLTPHYFNQHFNYHAVHLDTAEEVQGATPVTVQPRSFFRASPGFVLLAADYCQVELRLLAHFSGEPSLCAAFAEEQEEEGERDVFCKLATHWLGRSSSSSLPGEVTAEDRQLTKQLCYALLYGAGPRTLAQQAQLPDEQSAAQLRTSFLTSFPGLENYLSEVQEAARACGYVTTLLGRRRALPGLQSEEEAVRARAGRQAVNTLCQGSAADLIKLAMVRMHEALLRGAVGYESEQQQEEEEERWFYHSPRRHPGAGLYQAFEEVRLILSVHDEVGFEVRPRHLHTLAALLRRCMEEVAGEVDLRIPLRVKLSAGPSWAELRPLEERQQQHEEEKDRQTIDSMAKVILQRPSLEMQTEEEEQQEEEEIPRRVVKNLFGSDAL
eukprot:gene6257-6898_t